MIVQRDKCRISCRSVSEFAGKWILGVDPYSHFHGGASSKVNLGPDMHVMPQLDGRNEVKCIYRGGDYDSPGMTAGRNRRGDIDPAHDLSPKDRSQGIGVRWEDQLSHRYS